MDAASGQGTNSYYSVFYSVLCITDRVDVRFIQCSVAHDVICIYIPY